MNTSALIAYFSMEIALEPSTPTYSGGLGVLAGDTLRSFADLEMPVVAVTLVHRHGYFRQRLGARGGQKEDPDGWDPGNRLEPLPVRVPVEIEGRTVQIGGWHDSVEGESGGKVSVLLLDADRPENRARDRALTDRLYGGDARYRLGQEVILGLGGLRMLRALGYQDIERFHLNEGHAALVGVGLLGEEGEGPPRDAVTRGSAIKAVRERCVFTTHTPVPAGHDHFDAALTKRVLGPEPRRWIRALGLRSGLNMTELALSTAGFVNGVAMRHGEVSRRMFPDHSIESITNGIHAPTWAAPAFRQLFDRHIPEWKGDPLSLRQAVGIPLDEIAAAHARSKNALLRRVRRESTERWSSKTFTIGFARRATAYKRATLLFHEPDRLAEVAEEAGPLQIVLAGKAHPHDREGKEMIREIFRARSRLRGRVTVAYLENYEMGLAKMLCGGVDLWLNTPVPPLEASGTSGMKAALNGVPSFSTLDGWWVEGYVPGATGWSIGVEHAGRGSAKHRDEEDAEALLSTLERDILPCFYDDPHRYLEMMRSAIALNASFFNTQRMALQYLYRAYARPDESAFARGTGMQRPRRAR